MGCKLALGIVLATVVVAVAVLSGLAQRAGHKFGNDVQAPDHTRPDLWIHDSACDYVGGIVAAEDITVLPLLSDGRAVALADEDYRMEVWHMRGGAASAPEGAIFALDIAGRELHRLQIENFPDTVAFHPHGIHFLPSQFAEEHSGEGEGTFLGLLYVVSHAYRRGGERIEVLEVWDVSATAAAGGAPVRLSYRQSVTSDEYTERLMGIGNDVAVLSEGEFFVTQYLTFPDNRNGRQEGGWRQPLDEAAFLIPVLLDIKATAVWHCTYDPVGLGHAGSDLSEVTTEPHCVVALETVAANGIHVKRTTGEVYVVECIDRAVVVTEAVATGAGREKRLEERRRIELAFACDNLEIDQRNGRAFCGAVAKVALHGAHIDASLSFPHGLPPAVDEEGPDVPCSLGGAEEVLLDEGRAGGAVMVDTSRLCGGVSVATLAEHSGKSEVLLGSWCSEGILICPAP